MNEAQIMDSKALVNLIFVIDGDKVLLAKKTRKIGVGKWNGYGGAVEPGQTMTESAAEELKKESGLIAQPEDFEKIGTVDFYNQIDDGSVKVVKCDVFVLRKWTGKEKPSPEMADPQWFPINQLPFDEMMVADSEWIPAFLSGEANYAEAHQTDKQTRLLKPVILKKLPL